MTVAAGSPAPDFTMPTDGGGSVTLSQLRGKTVVLYFYPKAKNAQNYCGLSV